MHVYNVLWGIPESMGGMTTAALRRIRSFQTFGNSLSQTILTFNPRMDTDEIRDRLISLGKISDDVDLVNIWPELRGRTESALAELKGEPLRGPVPEEYGEIENINAFYDAFRGSAAGKIIRRNYRRGDGSLLVADIEDPDLGRRFILHSPTGTPLTEWRRPRDFYNAWIKAVVGKEPAVVIVDEKKVSEFIHEIPDRTFSLVLFLHGTHLRNPWDGNHGQVLPRRADTVRNFDRFDLVGVQTQQQAEAVRALGFGRDNIRLLTGELPSGSVLTDAPTRRPVNNAVMIANLIELKRVDHPIRAVAKLRDRGIDVTLTVLGEGPERPRLEQLIDEVDVADRVFLPGYVNDVPDRLASASFSTLTSTSEGLPLSMMEAMGAGCVPIVYDITYGPRDLIDQGRNGYITPFGDIDALADQFADFLALPPDEVDAMRRSAMATVERYLPEAGYQRWKAVLEELPQPTPTAELSAPRLPSIVAKSVKVRPTSRGCELAVEIDQMELELAALLELVVAAREHVTFFICGNPEVSKRRLVRRTMLTFHVDYAGFSESSGETFDVYLRQPSDLWTAKRRIQAPKGLQPSRAGEREWYSTNQGNLSVCP